MDRQCKDCGYLGKSKSHTNEYWCSWLGIFRKRNAEECNDGFKEKERS